MCPCVHFARLLRSRPSGVRGPVLLPPCSLQRPFGMAAPRQGLPVRFERAPHRGEAFALSNASKRARIRSIGSRSRGSLLIFRPSPAVAPPGPLPCRPRPRLARLRDVHLLVNVLHSDVLVSSGSLAL